MKAAVFPEPVSAMPMISFLANPMGIACLWMGEGFSYPEDKCFSKDFVR
jgi:hypothetical protein